MTAGKRRLVLLESPGDAQRLEASGPVRAKGVMRVCLAPAPAVELEALGVDYRFSHEYASSKAVQAAANENWQKLERLVAIINEHAPYGWTAAYYLKVLLDTCTEKIVHLDAVLLALEPEEVVFLETLPGGYDFQLGFDEQESLYARLLPLVARIRSPVAEMVPLSRLGGGGGVWCHLRWVAEARLPSFRRGQRLARDRNKTGASQTRSICLVEDGYGLGRAMAAVSGEYRVIRWAPWSGLTLPTGVGTRERVKLLWKACELPRARRVFREAWKAFRSDPRLGSLFSCLGVGFFDVVSSRLEYLFTQVFPHLSIIEKSAADVFRRCDVVCLASCYFSRPYSYVLSRAARSAGIPVVTLQHSSYGYWDWPIGKYVDGVMSDYKLVGGEGVVRYVERIERSGCLAISTGLVALDDGARRAPEGRRKRQRPLIVYPLASYIKNFIHYSNSRLALTEYFERNRRIIAFLARFPEVDVVVRPHPAPRFRQNCTPLKDWIERQGWHHIRVDSSSDTLTLMRTADLIVIDSPSTVLLEAMTTGEKIAVLNGIFPMTAEGLDALRKRVIYSDDMEAFLALLKDILQRGDFDNHLYKDGEFLQRFGTFRSDGRSLERIAEAVRAVASRRLVSFQLDGPN